MVDPFRDIATTYSNIISEAKARLEIVERALRGRPEDNLGYVALSDLCALQFRKTFEAIALACVAVHGDLPGINRMRNDGYRADKLLNRLERLHSDFYPKPCRVLANNDRGLAIGQAETVDLTKAELTRLYHLFDEEMHVGTLSRRSSQASVISADSYRTVLRQCEELILTHWIWLANGDRVLCEADRGNAIHISFLEPRGPLDGPNA